MSGSQNIALRGQELQKLMTSLKDTISGLSFSSGTDAFASNLINSLMAQLNEAEQEHANIPTQLEAALVREEEIRKAQEKALENAMDFLGSLSNSMQPMIDAYIKKNSEQFNEVTERNKAHLKFTNAELAATGEIDKEKAAEKAKEKLKVDVKENIEKQYNETKEATLALIKDAKISPIEKQILAISSIEKANQCTSGECMQEYETKLQVMNIPSSQLAPLVYVSMKSDALGEVNMRLGMAYDLEKPEQERLEKIYKDAGITNEENIEKKLGADGVAKLGQIIQTLHGYGDATSSKDFQHAALETQIAEFRKLAEKALSEKPVIGR